MKKLIIKFHYFLKSVFGSIFILFVVNNYCNSQQLQFYDCGTPEDSALGSSSITGGNYKPERSDLSLGLPADSASYFPTIIVFVQFADEPDDAPYWHPGEAPNFIDSLLRFTKISRSDWWNSYNSNSESVSSWWHEVSRGKLHVIGKAYSVILDHTASWYNSNGGESKVNFDAYEKLKQITEINWNFYDKWRKVNGQFKYESDGKVDMLYMVHRKTYAPLGNYEGYAPLGYANGQEEYEIDTVNHIKINGGYEEDGSGVKILGKFSVATKQLVLSAMGHEVGHYLFGSGHTVYSKMARGPGSEFFYSPWEMIKLGYMDPLEVDFSNYTYDYSIGDFSARQDTIETIIQVPISSSGEEFFLISNRRKVSQHDRIVIGDTLAYGSANQSSTLDYGKGTYIYHIFDGYTYPSYNAITNDLECADGLFDWQLTGTEAPDWDLGNPWLPVFEVLDVSYNNDLGSIGLTGKDGYNVFGGSYTQGKWFSKGRKESGFLSGGIDRSFTNLNENWTSRELYGDRYDAWKPGYNEVFSPYSSPSTKDKNDSTTGIYIWNNSVNVGTNISSYKIYKVGEGGMSDSSITNHTSVKTDGIGDK